MRHIFITLFVALASLGLCAQTSPVKVRTLVVKTTDGKTSSFNLADISEVSFEDGTSVVAHVMNLTPNFLAVSGVEQGQRLTPGETATLRLKATGILSEFEPVLFENIHIHINDMVLMPAVPEGFTSATEIEVPFTVPENGCDIVVCYSGQQQLIDNGYTMSLENHPQVKLYGVSPTAHYKYFDAYLLADEAYVITDADFRMGNGEWMSVNSTTGCSIARADNGVDNLYSVSIRPDYQNVTGDVALRISGEQHSRNTITWNNATAEYLDLEKSTLPTHAIDGEMVYAELYVNKEYYLYDVTSSDAATEIETNNRVYVRFTMPANDIAVSLDFHKKVPVSYVESEHVTKAVMYDAPDTYYGVPTEIGIPGDEVYLFAAVEEGYKPMTATTDDGKTFDFKYKGANHAGLPYYFPITISENVTSMSATISCARAWTVTSEQEVAFDEDGIYAEDETVSFIMKVPVGKRIDTVKAVTASGIEIPVAVDASYGSFIMPAENVSVSVTYADLEDGNQVKVIALFDEEQYMVRSSTNYDWRFEEGFMIDKGAAFYLSVYDFYGENFYVGVKVGDNVIIYPATEDEDSGEYTFGRTIIADGDVTIKVGSTESSVAF